MSSLIAPIASVISEAESIASPLVSDAVNQKYETAKKDRIIELQQILNLPDSLSRADRLQSYFVLLCNDCGTPARGLGDNISIPLDFIEALGAIAVNKLYEDQELAAANSKLTR